MDKTIAIIVTISILVVLAILFFVSFRLYVKTPPPKGCENLGRDESQCENCQETGCRFYQEAFRKAAEERRLEKEKEDKGDNK
ncbi:MAG: hypothetical protein J6328_04430 [Bacilli bacterium]|nr:hypothetical protein [Bacilli bacterium]